MVNHAQEIKENVGHIIKDKIARRVKKKSIMWRRLIESELSWFV
jgi:hypothetical protein